MRKADIVAIVTLLGSGMVIASPILNGGYSTYLDNPAHLAEVYSLARDGAHGWSDIAWCGYPLGSLHSPLWYGFLREAVEHGLAPEPLYALLVLFGYLFPAFALYAVARRRLDVAPAAMLAYLLLIQHPGIVGVGSALGGMWTFYIGAGILILLVDRLANPSSSRGAFAVLAAAYGFIGLTHLYAIIPATLLCTTDMTIRALRWRQQRTVILQRVAAAAVGALASASYWLPFVLAADNMVVEPQNLPSDLALARFLLPTNLVELVMLGRVNPLSGLDYTFAIPMILLVVAGLAGAGVCLRRRRSSVATYGALLAFEVLVLVILVAPGVKASFLGPNSWRMLYFARIGFALAAIPILEWLTTKWSVSGRVRMTALVVAALAASVWWSRPLASACPSRNGNGVAEVQALWGWLRAHHDSSWGRVYVEDTYLTPPLNDLQDSHILAMTGHEAGVKLLGATYAIVPFRTAQWTSSGFGQIFRLVPTSPRYLPTLQKRLRAANVTHLVISNPDVATMLTAQSEFEVMFEVGRFTVLQDRTIEGSWVEPLTGGLTATVERFSTEEVIIRTESKWPDAALVIKSSYWPFWRLQADSRMHLRSMPTGLMRIEGIPAGKHDIALSYRPPRFPYGLSMCGWLTILVVAAVALRLQRPISKLK